MSAKQKYTLETLLERIEDAALDWHARLEGCPDKTCTVCKGNQQARANFLLDLHTLREVLYVPTKEICPVCEGSLRPDKDWSQRCTQCSSGYIREPEQEQLTEEL